MQIRLDGISTNSCQRSPADDKLQSTVSLTDMEEPLRGKLLGTYYHSEAGKIAGSGHVHNPHHKVNSHCPATRDLLSLRSKLCDFKSVVVKAHVTRSAPHLTSPSLIIPVYRPIRSDTAGCVSPPADTVVIVSPYRTTGQRSVRNGHKAIDIEVPLFMIYVLQYNAAEHTSGHIKMNVCYSILDVCLRPTQIFWTF